jgi:hypothetical protein
VAETALTATPLDARYQRDHVTVTQHIIRVRAHAIDAHIDPRRSWIETGLLETVIERCPRSGGVLDNSSTELEDAHVYPLNQRGPPR